jgi:uncharacterized protein (DUF302 family)
MSFQSRRELKSSFDEVVARLPQALKSEGFGVLTEIDIKDTLKKKLDVDFRRYKIFGACNPPLAHQALQAELEIGLMLPCNVIVYEGDQGHTVVAAIDPTQTMATVGNPKLVSLAGQVRDKLTRALAQLE